MRVYERYLGTWPDRPQRRIYELLAHHYALRTRVDEQAQKIYEEALADNPTDPQVVQILARAYHANDRRDDTAEMLYRQAFPQVTDDIKKQLAAVLAEMRFAAQDFSQETLLYLTTAVARQRGHLLRAMTRPDELLPAAGRRGEAAQEAYFALFERTENSPELIRRWCACWPRSSRRAARCGARQPAPSRLPQAVRPRPLLDRLRNRFCAADRIAGAQGAEQPRAAARSAGL